MAGSGRPTRHSNQSRHGPEVEPAPPQSFELRFRTPCPYPKPPPPESIPDLPISVWGNWAKEFVQLPTHDPREAKSLAHVLKQGRRQIEGSRHVESGYVFVLNDAKGLSDENTSAIIAAHGCIELPPMVCRGGWRYFRVIGFDSGHVSRLYRALATRGPIEVLSKREVPFGMVSASPWIEAFLRDLTPGQVDAVIRAHHEGYYATPRKTTTKKLAVGAGIPSSTFEAHHRKAENRILSIVAPYLEWYLRAVPVEHRHRATAPDENESTDHKQDASLDARHLG